MMDVDTQESRIVYISNDVVTFDKSTHKEDNLLFAMVPRFMMAHCWFLMQEVEQTHYYLF